MEMRRSSHACRLQYGRRIRLQDSSVPVLFLCAQPLSEHMGLFARRSSHLARKLLVRWWTPSD